MTSASCTDRHALQLAGAVACSGCGTVLRNAGSLGNHAKYSPNCTAEMRFWGKVEKSDGCWTWKGAVTSKWGYGCVSWQGRVLGAHKVSWLLTNGATGELCVLHHCDNRVCVNPSHLYLGTKKDNSADKKRRGRDTTIGEGNVWAKLKDDQVREIRRIRKETGLSYYKIAPMFRISYSTVRYICEGHTWKHLL